jgi:arsenate reductase (thioredoxin)
MTTVVFACVHNAGRSQMAAALFNAVVDQAKARAVSAGTQPATQVHPEVVDVLREIGIDLTGVRPTLLTEDVAAGADWLVTMGCGEACPTLSGVRRMDWTIPDPKGRPIDAVRRIREEIRQRVMAFVTSEDWLAPAPR